MAILARNSDLARLAVSALSLLRVINDILDLVRGRTVRSPWTAAIAFTPLTTPRSVPVA